MNPRSGTPCEHAAAQLTTYGQSAEMVLLIGGHLRPRGMRHGVSIAETQVGAVRDSVDKGPRGFRISGDSDKYFVKIHTSLDHGTRRKVPKGVVSFSVVYLEPAVSLVTMLLSGLARGLRRHTWGSGPLFFFAPPGAEFRLPDEARREYEEGPSSDW